MDPDIGTVWGLFRLLHFQSSFHIAGPTSCKGLPLPLDTDVVKEVSGSWTGRTIYATDESVQDFIGQLLSLPFLPHKSKDQHLKS